MKNLMHLYLMLICAGSIAQNRERFAAAEKVVWCGVDFSFFKFIDKRSEADTCINLHPFFDFMNGRVIALPHMYPVEYACGRNPVAYRAEIVRDNNLRADTCNILTNHEYLLDSAKIKSLIEGYQPITLAPIAFVLIAESFNVRSLRGEYYTVFFDTATREIIWMKRYHGVSKGETYGFFWARPIDAVLRYLADDFKREVLNDVVRY